MLILFQPYGVQRFSIYDTLTSNGAIGCNHVFLYFRREILMTKDSANLDYLIALVDLLATCAEVSI